MPKNHRLYTELAPWWPLMSLPESYASEAGLVRHLLGHDGRRRNGAKPTMLELGCGGGNNAVHLAEHYDLTLVDLSPEMLALAAALVPSAHCVQGDMRSLRLDQRFDAVLLHDAVMYMTSTQDLQDALITAAHHLRPGGRLALMPDFTAETFHPGTTADGSDDEDTGRAIRYLEWSFDPDPRDETVQVDFSLLLRDADGNVRAIHDRHTWGKFSTATWEALVLEAGLQVHTEPIHREEDGWEGVAFVGQKPR